MSGEPSSTLLTAETMHSVGIHLSATDALIRMAKQTPPAVLKEELSIFKPSERMGSAFNQ